jgi:hypothetical protein
MNIISYFIGGHLHKIYIEFAISGTLMVEESEKDKVTLEMSKLIAKFMKHKNVVKLDNNFETIDDTDFINHMVEVGEA